LTSFFLIRSILNSLAAMRFGRVDLAPRKNYSQWEELTNTEKGRETTKTS
jgi:hypothetical protein